MSNKSMTEGYKKMVGDILFWPLSGLGKSSNIIELFFHFIGGMFLSGVMLPVTAPLVGVMTPIYFTVQISGKVASEAIHGACFVIHKIKDKIKSKQSEDQQEEKKAIEYNANLSLSMEGTIALHVKELLKEGEGQEFVFIVQEGMTLLTIKHMIHRNSKDSTSSKQSFQFFMKNKLINPREEIANLIKDKDQDGFIRLGFTKMETFG